jgi:saccharopine dehydrogenase-like NADP-dependent oxidoreductase
MARTTGFTCTAVANLILEKKYKKTGISPPEYLGEHFEFIRKYLYDRNVIYNVIKE